MNLSNLRTQRHSVVGVCQEKRFGVGKMNDNNILKAYGIREGFYKITDSRCNNITHTDTIIKCMQNARQDERKRMKMLIKNLYIPLLDDEKCQNALNRYREIILCQFTNPELKEEHEWIEDPDTQFSPPLYKCIKCGKRDMDDDIEKYCEGRKQ